LVKAPKRIHRVIFDNTQTKKDVDAEWRVTYEIRKVASPHEALSLRFFARLEAPLTARVVKPVPGASLLWFGKRIRGIDWRLTKPVFRNGVIVGYVKGWHEHLWTDTDEDRFAIEIQVKRPDLRSFIEFCLKRWHVDGGGKQLAFKSNGE